MKIGDRVKILDAVDGKTSVKFEQGRVLYLGRRALIQFDSNVCGHNGNGLGKNRYCWMCEVSKVEEVN